MRDARVRTSVQALALLVVGLLVVAGCSGPTEAPSDAGDTSGFQEDGASSDGEQMDVPGPVGAPPEAQPAEGYSGPRIPTMPAQPESGYAGPREDVVEDAVDDAAGEAAGEDDAAASDEGDDAAAEDEAGDGASNGTDDDASDDDAGDGGDDDTSSQSDDAEDGGEG